MGEANGGGVKMTNKIQHPATLAAQGLGWIDDAGALYTAEAGFINRLQKFARCK